MLTFLWIPTFSVFLSPAIPGKFRWNLFGCLRTGRIRFARIWRIWPRIHRLPNDNGSCRQRSYSRNQSFTIRTKLKFRNVIISYVGQYWNYPTVLNLTVNYSEFLKSFNFLPWFPWKWLLGRVGCMGWNSLPQPPQWSQGCVWYWYQVKNNAPLIEIYRII